jgi:polo-like kinase 1
LLVGKPPFETQSLKETYGRIKRNEYYIPSKVQHPAQLLIIKLLRPDPSTRPTMAEILEDEFFQGYIPTRLPVSCLTMLPKFASSSNLSTVGARKPLLELNTQDTAPPPVSRKSDAYSKRKSLGIRVVGTESTMVQPGEAAAEEVIKEEENGTVFCCINLQE